MKRTFAITILTLLIPTTAFAAVRITEVAWMGIAGENGQYGEWVELYNDRADNIDLAGWKLYGGGGNDLIFTLTKRIAANSYLLIERQTATMQDAVPGVDDESGVFGSGGLSNTGEHLVLKDANGAIAQSLDYSSGWPAGDAATKETMQWDGTAWVTAPATPKASVGAQAGDDGDRDVSDTQEVKQKSSKPVVHTEPHVDIFAPAVALMHVSYPFNVQVVLEKGVKNPNRGIYRWNFGDGTALIQSDKINPVMHTYEYPGEYTVWFGYYESIFSTEPKIASKVMLTVQEPAVSAGVIDGTAIRLVNETDDAVDLSNWIVHSGNSTGILPPMTLLSPGATIVLKASTLGMTLSKTVVLAAPDDYLFVHRGVTAVAVAPAPVASDEPAVKGEMAEAPLSPDADNVIALEDSGPATTNNRTKEILFGAIAVTIIGLFLLLERFMARQE